MVGWGVQRQQKQSQWTRTWKWKRKKKKTKTMTQRDGGNEHEQNCYGVTQWEKERKRTWSWLPGCCLAEEVAGH